MSSHSWLQIDGRGLLSFRNGFDGSLSSLFRESERSIRRPKLSPALAADYGIEYLLEDLDEICLYQYQSTVKALRDRLDLNGVTLEYAAKVFDDDLKALIERETAERDKAASDEFGKHLAQRVDALRKLSFKTWTDGFLRIFSENLTAENRRRSGFTPLDDYPVTFMLQELDAYGFPSSDTRVILRAMLDGLPGETLAVLDLTYLLLGDLYEEDHLTFDLDEVAISYQVWERIIVLTEGRSDQRILKAAIGVICPHLQDYFAFMDFEEMAVPGGAGTLVAFLKAFAGAGVANRVLAVFDNDTAATSALRALEGLTLPPNVGFVRLPDRSALESYPTLGPTGIAPVNINGLAASIELYFGRDVLLSLDGTLEPVHWKGYDHKLRQYQGEILGKPRLQKAFLRKAPSVPIYLRHLPPRNYCRG